MNRLFHRSIFTLTTFVAGCASSMYGDLRTDPCFGGYIDERRLAAELEQSSPCCRDFSNVKFTPAVVDDDHTYVLHKAAPVFDFPSGRSRFMALELPPGKKSHLFVRPYPSGRTSIAQSCADTRVAVFVGEGSEWYRAIEPVITYLDSDKNVLARAVPANSPDTGDYRHPIPPNAAFVIIHTVPERLGVKRRIFLKRMDQSIPVASGGAFSVLSPAHVAAVVTGTGLVLLRYED